MIRGYIYRKNMQITQINIVVNLSQIKLLRVP